MNRAISCAAFAAFLAVMTTGCSSYKPPTFDEQTIASADQFKQIVAAYNQAFRAKRRSPTADDLKPFLKQYGDPDKLLTSARDGKPLVIVPGFSPNLPAGDDEMSIIAYEQTGADGKRMTADIRGTIVFYTDAEFANLKFVGGHQPAR